MPISTRVKRYLEANGARFKIHRLPNPVESLNAAVITKGIDPQAVISVQVYQHESGQSLVAYPLASRINKNRLQQFLGDDIKRVNVITLSSIFDDCAPSALPPLAAPYQLQLILEQSLLDKKIVYFYAGCPQTLVSVSIDEFRFLNPEAVVMAISEIDNAAEKRFSPECLDEVVDRKMSVLPRVPPMPDKVKRILDLMNDPESEASDLSRLIVSDHRLSKLVLDYAHTVLISDQDRPDTVQEVITRGLGYDVVSNIALGGAVSHAFDISADVRTDISRCWEQSIYSAELCRLLTSMVDPSLDMKASKSQLCGMFHQVGLVVMAHLFPPEYGLLCRLVGREPEQPLHQLETRVMGFGQARDIFSLGYARVGGWLLCQWQMPDEVIAAAKYHSQLGEAHIREPYVALTQLANYLLTLNGIGCATLEQLDDRIPEMLGVSLHESQFILDKLLKRNKQIEQLSLNYFA